MSSEIQKQYQITSKIGNGNFSTVFLAKHISTQQIVAVKTMKNHIPIAIKQAQILKKMNHPNIIKLHQFQKPKHKEQVMIVLQYVPENILELYEAQQYGLKQEQVKCILFQCCLGLYHIHKKGIIHRDIKPENIMINRSKAEVKIIDFGLAIQQEKCITDYVATRWYRAPQNLLGTKEYTVAIDIFSLGCVIVELYLGNPLFPGANNVDQIGKILSMIEEPTVTSWRKGAQMLIKLGLRFNQKNDKKKLTLKNLLSSCSEGLSKLVQKMLILNPQKRITAQQILKDPYFNGIQKIIPPHVYDRYLADFKSTRSSMIKDIPKLEKRNESKQRIRFLSQEKAFGAFTSFKSITPLNKFQPDVKKQTEQIPPEKSSSAKVLSFQKILQDCGTCQEGNLQPVVLSKSRKSSVIKNQIIKDSPVLIQDNPSTGISEATSSIKKSLQKYEKNIMKLSTSLKNIKLLKSEAQLRIQKPAVVFKPIQVSNEELKQIKSTEMLSFRGFNQPKQKISMKEAGTTFIKRYPQLQLNEQKVETVPIKNKKVMEYLQKFQTIANQSQQFQRQKLQNSRSEPEIYQSANGTPKKPYFIASRTPVDKQQYFSNQIHKNFVSNSFSLSPRENIPIHNPSSGNLLSSQSFQRNHLQMNQSQNIKSPEMAYSVSPNAHLKQSYQQQKQSMFQPQRYLTQQQTSNFNSFNRDRQRQKQFLPIQTQSSFDSSRVQQEPQNVMLNTYRSVQPYSNEPKSLNSSNYFMGLRNSINSPESSINPNRPIQNKIKLIAARDSLPMNTREMSQTYFMTPPVSSANQSRNPSYYQSGSNFIDKSHTNLSQQNVQLLQKDFNYVQRSEKFHIPDYQLKQSLGADRQQKTKQFKSLEHRQFYSKKFLSNRYSINTTQEPPKVGYTKNYLSLNLLNESPVGNELKPSTQKNNQTTLSQLRQSITGLSQSLNEGAFLSERSQRFNNNHKNININLNLNIYEKRPNKKR